MTTPVAAPVPNLSKRWAIEVDTSATSTPTWTRLKGLTGIGMPISTTKEPTTTFDSGMWKGADWTVELGWSLTGSVLRLQYADSAAPGKEDPGQKALREASLPDATTGQPKQVHVRWMDRFGGPEAYEGYASVEWSPNTGGKLESADFTLSGNGERLTITNPITAP